VHAARQALGRAVCAGPGVVLRPLHTHTSLLLSVTSFAPPRVGLSQPYRDSCSAAAEHTRPLMGHDAHGSQVSTAELTQLRSTFDMAQLQSALHVQI
jgi:hypothetical protein